MQHTPTDKPARVSNEIYAFQTGHNPCQHGYRISLFHADKAWAISQRLIFIYAVLATENTRWYQEATQTKESRIATLIRVDAQSDVVRSCGNEWRSRRWYSLTSKQTAFGAVSARKRHSSTPRTQNNGIDLPFLLWGLYGFS